MAKALLRLGLKAALGLLMFLALWVALAAYLKQEVVPYPDVVWEALREETVQNDLLRHTEVSTRRVLLGMGLATGLGWPLGVILGQNRVLNTLLAPLIGLLYPIPKIVFLPVVFVLFGLGDASKVALIAVIVFFQVLVVVRDDSRRISGELVESVRSLGAGRRALFWFVYIPASLGSVLTAWRVSVGTAVAVLFIAELNLTREGLGYYINLKNNRLRYDEMYAGIVAMSLLGVGLYLITDVLERVFVRWKQSE